MATSDTEHGDARFPLTRGSIVASLSSENVQERSRAWETLAQLYWKPSYKYIRVKWRRAPEAAQDLTQGFFARAYEKDYFQSFDAGRARFRTFLRVCLDAFIMNEAKAERSLKRGGGAPNLSLDYHSAEDELGSEPVPAEDQLDEYFHAEWVRAVFAAAVADLRRSLESAGHGERFEVFRLYDLADVRKKERPKYEEIAAQLGVPVTTITNWLFSMRREFKEHILNQLRAITANDEELRDEARALLGKDAL